MIYENRQNMMKKMAFLTLNSNKCCKHLIITLICKENTHFFTENRHKLLKLIIVSVTPEKLFGQYMHTYMVQRKIVERQVVERQVVERQVIENCKCVKSSNGNSSHELGRRTAACLMNRS
jgi:hypothetical protein